MESESVDFPAWPDVGVNVEVESYSGGVRLLTLAEST